MISYKWWLIRNSKSKLIFIYRILLMGACINTAKVQLPVVKRQHSKKTSIEDRMELTNLMKKLKRFEEIREKRSKRRNSTKDELETGIN